MLKPENEQKIVMGGDFRWEIYEKALSAAFSQLGYNVYEFGWGRYFNDSFLNKTQEYFKLGPIIKKINSDLAEFVKNTKPDICFIYRGVYIFLETILNIKKAGTFVFGYNNDDPFGKNYPFYFWRHFKRSIPYYDHIFSYRLKNIEDYKKIGYKNTSLLRSYHIKDKNFPIEKLPTNKYKCDVIFAGHYEDDGREECLKAIIDADVNFKLFGPEWQSSKYYNFFKEKLGEIYNLKEDYNLALNSAKIALCFLSKLNNDTYTRRNFEIPAAKTFMLSEYSDDLNSLFKEGVEAEYFRSKEEMIEKIKYYLQNDKEREKIAMAGYQRLLKDGHEAEDRVKEIIRVFNTYKL